MAVLMITHDWGHRRNREPWWWPTPAKRWNTRMWSPSSNRPPPLHPGALQLDPAPDGHQETTLEVVSGMVQTRWSSRPAAAFIRAANTPGISAAQTSRSSYRSRKPSGALLHA